MFTPPGGFILHLAKFSLDGVRLRDEILPPLGIELIGGLASLLSSFLVDLEEVVFSFLTLAGLANLSSAFGVLGDDAAVFLDLNSLSSMPGDAFWPLLVPGT